MKIAMIGAGNCGAKIVDKALELQLETGRDFVSHATVLNSAAADFQVLDYVPDNPARRLLIGESRMKGHGAGTDNTVGRKMAEDDIERIKNAIGDIAIHEIDAFVVCASFGGGTGSGAAPVVAEHLQSSYDEPVYGLGILPGRDEGGIYQLNAARSFPSLVRVCDNVIVFDNEVWRGGGTESVSGSYDMANSEIARRFVTLFAAGEKDGSTAAENVVDSSEIIKTLDCGGVSSIGYSTAEVDEGVTDAAGGLLSRFKNGDGKNGTSDRRTETKVLGLVRQATTGQLTLPADVSSTTRALALLSGPQAEMSRKGLESGRHWLEEQCQTQEVRGGDDPRDQDHLAGVVLLSGLTECARIEEFQDQADAAKQKKDELDEQVDDATEDLISGDGEVDSLL
jgi:cell division GTPase FtsZ